MSMKTMDYVELAAELASFGYGAYGAVGAAASGGVGAGVAGADAAGTEASLYGLEETPSISAGAGDAVTAGGTGTPLSVSAQVFPNTPFNALSTSAISEAPTPSTTGGITQQQLTKIAEKYGTNVALKVAQGQSIGDALKPDPTSLPGLIGGSIASTPGAKVDDLNDIGVGLPSETDSVAPPHNFRLIRSCPPAPSPSADAGADSTSPLGSQIPDLGGLPAPNAPTPISGLDNFANSFAGGAAPTAQASAPVVAGPAPGDITASGAPGLGGTDATGFAGRSIGAGGMPVALGNAGRSTGNLRRSGWREHKQPDVNART